jgi:uncharacterized protein
MLESAAALRAFLEHPDRPAGTLNYAQLQGFLFAVAGAPELILPSEWMPEVLGGDTPEFRNVDEARTIQSALVEEYNAVNDASLQGDIPPGCVLRDEPMANLDDDAPIREWARGFARGYGWLEETWEDYLSGDGESDDPREQEMETEFSASVMILSFFASSEFAETVVSDSVGKDLPTFASEVHELFPEALRAYAGIGRAIQMAVDQIERTPYQRESPKIGRNDLCPCGSGRKYKRCCGVTH